MRRLWKAERKVEQAFFYQPCGFSSSLFEQLPWAAGLIKGSLFFIMNIHPGTTIALTKKHGPHTAVILILIASNASDSGECFISYSDICDATGFSRSTVSAALKFLIFENIIKQVKGYRMIAQYSISTEVVLLDSTTSSLINSVNDKIEPKGSAVVEKYRSTTNELLDNCEAIPFQILSDAFTNTTKIQFYNPPKWIEAVNAMLNQGVEAQDIETAFKELAGKYNIIGPWSIVNAAVGAMSKRKTNGNGNHKPAVIAPPAGTIKPPEGTSIQW
jgi:DNA-binding transcriptional regulator GbsR (MarR family)